MQAGALDVFNRRCQEEQHTSRVCRESDTVNSWSYKRLLSAPFSTKISGFISLLPCPRKIKIDYWSETLHHVKPVKNWEKVQFTRAKDDQVLTIELPHLELILSWFAVSIVPSRRRWCKKQKKQKSELLLHDNSCSRKAQFPQKSFRSACDLLQDLAWRFSVDPAGRKHECSSPLPLWQLLNVPHFTLLYREIRGNIPDTRGQQQFD